MENLIKVMRNLRNIILFTFLLALSGSAFCNTEKGPGPKGIILGTKYNRIYVISIGISDESNDKGINTPKLSYMSTGCATCLSDAIGFPAYLNKLKSRTSDLIDTVIAFQYINKDITIDTLYKAFLEIQNRATANDVFVFYYAGISWGSMFNEETGANEGFYAINRKLTAPDRGNTYSFTLKILKALTDRIAAQRQLVIFDTGQGEVIEADYYKNFFSENPTNAYFTKKNRIVMCPEYLSSESLDDKEGIKKGDMFKVISNLPDNLNIFTLFDTSMYKRLTHGGIYKQFMKALYEQQLDCAGQIKILKELDYLRMLTAIKTNKATSGKRGIEPADEKEVDTSLLSFPKRKKKALIVATNEYEASSMWDKLRNPINDGTAVADILEKEYGYGSKDTVQQAQGFNNGSYI
jgi:hypothetical protein